MILLKRLIALATASYIIPPSAALDMYINAGGDDYVDSFGNTWVKDNYFSLGSLIYYSSNPISGTFDDELYHTERYAGIGAGTGELEYKIPLINGDYNIILHFVEIYFHGAEQRVFDVIVGGISVANSLDIHRDVGKNTVLTKSTTVSVENELLTITFQSKLNNAKISAIEIHSLSTTEGMIEKIRKRDAQITILNSQGLPIKNTLVNIKQSRRHFAFGTAIKGDIRWNSNIKNFLIENFEWAVPENEVKWYTNEKTQGIVTYQIMDEMYEICKANDIKVRGHPIFWSVEKWVQDWVKGLNNEDLRAALENRLHSVVGHFKGKFPHWDVNNEMIHGSYFVDRLGDDIRPWMFNEAKKVDPHMLTFTNDYNIITNAGKVEEYKAQVRGLIAANATIDAIGIQGHFKVGVDKGLLKERLDSLAELGLPLWITEYDCVQPDVNIRAKALENLYTVAFAHPAVHGVLMWGFWAGNHWRGADAAIVDEDWTVNAAGKMFQSLMKKWRTALVKKTTNNDGIVSFRGFHGKYNVTFTRKDGEVPETYEIYLEPGSGKAFFTITLPCRVCTDNPTKWMLQNGKECSTWTYAHENKCNLNDFWRTNKFCQKSCYWNNNGYDGDDCCE